MSNKNYEESIKNVKNYEPDYEIIPILRTPEINSGDNVIIDIYWTGYGIPDESKVQILHSGLSTKDDVEVQMASIFKKIDGKFIDLVGGDAIRSISLHADNAIVFPLDKNLFFPEHKNTSNITKIDYNSEDVIKSEEISLILNSEIPHYKDEMEDSEYPPIRIKIPTTKEQSSGNIRISTTLTYTYNNKTYTSKDFVNLTVRNWVQKHRMSIKWIGIIVGILTLLITIFSLSIDIYNFIL